MRIWHKDYTLESLKSLTSQYMTGHLRIEFIEIGPDYLKARMPVDDHTHTPRGLLHGGASCALAETVGSTASFLSIDPDKQTAVGLEINANHLRGVREGYVIGTARPVHIGRSTHVWDIRIHAEDSQKPVCISRLTVAILQKNGIS